MDRHIWRLIFTSETICLIGISFLYSNVLDVKAVEERKSTARLYEVHGDTLTVGEVL